MFYGYYEIGEIQRKGEYDFYHTTGNMKCSNCGADLNQDVTFCPVCGTKVQADTETEMLPKEDTVTEMLPKEENATEILPNEGMETTSETVTETQTDTEQKEKAKFNILDFAKKIKLPHLIVGCVIVLVALLCVANSSALANTMKKIVSSPEEYYQWVEKKAVKDAAASVADYYEDFFLRAVTSYDQSAEVQLSFKFEEAMEEWLEMVDEMGVDISWLDSGKLAWNHNLKNGVMQEKAVLDISNQEILEAALVLDFNGQYVYGTLPTLVDTYLGVELDEVMSDYEIEEMQTSLELLKKLDSSLPKASTVNGLIEKYIKIIVSHAEDVKLTKDKTCRVEGVNQKCTRLEVTIDADMMSEALQEVFEALAEDKDIKKIIYDVYNAVCEMEDVEPEETADDIYGDFVETCENMKDSAKDLEGEEEVVMTLFVDGKGNVVGRKVEIESEGIEMEFLHPQDGNKVAYRFSFVEEGYYSTNSIALEGSGKKSGDTVTGDFILEYNDSELLELAVSKFDVEGLKAGYINGKVGIQMASGLSKMMDYGDYDGDYYASSLVSMLKDFNVSVEMAADASSSNVRLILNEDEEKLATIDITGKNGSGSGVSVPSGKKVWDAAEFDDVAEWWDSFDWTKLLKNLDKTEMPSKYIDAVEELSEIDGEDLGSIY